MANFKRFNNYFTDISRHFEARKFGTAVRAGNSDLDLFVDTIRSIVRWLMQKFYGDMPSEAKDQYEQVFETPFLTT